MEKFFKRRWYLFIPLIIAGIIAFGFVIMALWNYTMPAIFKLPEITYWQAVCLLILSRIFFGSGPRSSHHGKWSHKRWERMTPEERESFHQRWKARCGDFRKEEPTIQGS